MINWDNIEEFVGYGPENAPVVFIGMEEGTSRNLENLPNELSNRSQWKCFRELNAPNGATVRTWRVMCDFMLRRQLNNSINRGSRLAYQRNSLGRMAGESLIAELMPYPSPAANVWPYDKLGRDKDRKAYFERLRLPRTQLIGKVLAAHPREFVVCYGKAYSNYFKEIFPANLAWQNRRGFEIADWNGARIAITPHFSGRAFNTDEQMATLYRELTSA